MLSRVNLVAILFTLNYVIRASECSWPSVQERRQDGIEITIAPDERILKYAAYGGGNVTSSSPPFSTTRSGDGSGVVGARARDDHGAHSKSEVKERVNLKDRPRLKKGKMDRTLLALLMAYKLKFIALIPTMIGGLLLLKGTMLLAGFFFALFAAVLGLKAH